MKQELRRKFIGYTAPTVTSMWVYALYTMVDGVFVARGVGEEALAAVNLCIPYNCFVLALGVMFALGASTKMSIALGAEDVPAACRIFSQNTATVALVGAALSLAVAANTELFARLLGAEGDILGYTVEYLRNIACFSVCFLVSYNMEIQVKADGAPLVATIGVTACGLTNVGLDALFVLGFGWGVAGAAIATGIAQTVSMLLFLGYFIFRSRRVHFGRFRFSLRLLWDTVKLGVSGFIGELDASFTALLYNRIILAVSGGTGLIAYTVIAYVQTLVANTMMGVSQGVCPLISYSLGAGRKNDVRDYRRLAQLTLLAAGLLAVAVCELLADPIAGIYIDRGHGAFDAAVGALRLYAPSFLLSGFVIFSINDLMATDRPRASLALSLCSIGLTCAAVCVMGLTLGAVGVWLSALAAKAVYLAAAGLVMRKIAQS